MGCGSGFSGQSGKVRATPYLHVRHRSTCGSEIEQGLKSGRRMLAQVMAKDEFIE